MSIEKFRRDAKLIYDHEATLVLFRDIFRDARNDYAEEKDWSDVNQDWFEDAFTPIIKRYKYGRVQYDTSASAPRETGNNIIKAAFAPLKAEVYEPPKSNMYRSALLMWLWLRRPNFAETLYEQVNEARTEDSIKLQCLDSNFFADELSDFSDENPATKSEDLSDSNIGITAYETVGSEIQTVRIYKTLRDQIAESSTIIIATVVGTIVAAMTLLVLNESGFFSPAEVEPIPPDPIPSSPIIEPEKQSGNSEVAEDVLMEPDGVWDTIESSVWINTRDLEEFRKYSSIVDWNNIKTAANLGNSNAKALFAILIWLGESSEYSEIEVVNSLLRPSCEEDQALSCYLLSESYRLPYGVNTSTLNFVSFGKHACSLGHLVSCENTGIHLYNDVDGEPDERLRGLELLDKACSLELETSCVQLGHIFEEARYVERDMAAAEQYFSRGCKYGSSYRC